MWNSPVLRTGVLLLLAFSTSVAAWHAVRARLQVLVPDRVIRVQDAAELSGIAYWQAHRTLIGVADNGEVTEIALDGTVLRRTRNGKRDLEDLVLATDPAYAYALVTEEATRRILRLRLDNLRFQDMQPIGFKALPEHSPNKQFEGITLQPALRRGVLANEAKPAALVFAEALSGAVPPDVVLLDAQSVSAVISDGGDTLLLVSRDQGLQLLHADGAAAGTWHPVAGRHVEGAAMVPGVGLVLCTDQNPSRLLVFSSLATWDDVRHALEF